MSVEETFAKVVKVVGGHAVGRLTRAVLVTFTPSGKVSGSRRPQRR